MHKSIIVVLALACGCAHHEAMRGLDVTTTSATFQPRTTAQRDAFDSAAAHYEAEHADAPGPAASTAPTDAQIGALVESATAIESDRALYAGAHAGAPIVQSFAKLVYARMREARVALSMFVPAPDYVPPATTDLRAVAAQSLVDFDRVYLGLEKNELGALSQKLDELAPRVSDPMLARRLLELRPLVEDLYAQAFEIERTLR